MRRFASLAAVVTLLASAMSEATAQELDASLRFLAPLAATEWSGRMVSFANGQALPPTVPMAAPGFYRVRWESLLGGKVLQQLQSTSTAPSTPVRTTFYWDATLGQVAYLAVSDRTLDRGIIRGEQGRFIRTGTLTFANVVVNYVDTWELTADGTLRQRYVPSQGNGHVLELAKASPPGP